MENYTKYKLKDYGELADLLEGKDNLFVIACNKCFKEFETVNEPDCDAFVAFAKDRARLSPAPPRLISCATRRRL